VYFRTFDEEADGGVALATDGGPTMEADPATVSGFRLDKFEVTVGRFRQYVKYLSTGLAPGTGAGKHAHLNGGQGLAGQWTYDHIGAFPTSCVNCASLTSTLDAGASRVNKGGAYDDPPSYIRTTMRGDPPGGPYVGVDNIGFRCARTP
jgi:formylglycine-generating enzyme required for sulfatase activity